MNIDSLHFNGFLECSGSFPGGSCLDARDSFQIYGCLTTHDSLYTCGGHVLSSSLACFECFRLLARFGPVVVFTWLARLFVVGFFNNLARFGIVVVF